MPVRIVSDENLPIEYFDVSLDNQNCYLSTVDGEIYDDDEKASENNGNIDLVFFVDEREDGLIFVFFAPILLNDPNFLGADNVMEWGIIPTEFRKTNLTPDDFDALSDFTTFNDIFDQSTIAPYIFDAPDGTHCTSYDGTVAEGKVIGFKGAYDTIGFIKISTLHPDGIIFDLKVQPRQDNA